MIKLDYNFDQYKMYSNKILKKEIYNNKNIAEHSVCPYCNKHRIIKFGKYDGIQRYRCKDCKKTFSNTTNSIWKYSKSPVEKWFKFTELLIQEKTLEYCSKTLDISIVTAFYWRHKILHAMEKNYMPNSFNNVVFMNLNTQGLSNKGSKGMAYQYRDKFSKRYDLFRTRVYLINLYDTNDSMHIKVIGTTNNWWKNSDIKVFKKIDKKAYIKAIDGRTFRDNVIKHNKKVSLKFRKNIEYDSSSYYLKDNIKCSDRIYQCNLILSKWLGKFKGVASKYLNHYCCLFSLSFVKKQYNNISIFFDLLSNNFLEQYYLRANNIKSLHESEFFS